jgi:hypothetical protein
LFFSKITSNQEIEKAWKMLDASHEKEAHANETIQRLKSEINNLTKLVEQGSGLALDRDLSVKSLIDQKEKLAKGN